MSRVIKEMTPPGVITSESVSFRNETFLWSLPLGSKISTNLLIFDKNCYKMSQNTAENYSAKADSIALLCGGVDGDPHLIW